MREKAKALYDEYRSSMGLYDYSEARKRGFRKRCRNLAKRISRQGQHDEILAMMYLDSIATRAGFEITEWAD